jgi:hypothetical protein
MTEILIAVHQGLAALAFWLLVVFKTEWASCSRSHDEEMSRPDAPGRSP